MAAKTTNKLKGNPAGKRMTNSHHKEKHTRAHARSEKRKQARREAQEARRAANDALRAQGLPTPWERVRMARRASRLLGASHLESVPA